MRLDRYVKGLLTLIALALAVIALTPWLAPLGLPTAEAQSATPKYEVTIPKSWGRIIGFSNNNLLLQADDGALRVVDVEGKPPEYPKVKVLARWN